jgi:flagellar protein FliO/FliZ
MNPGQYTQVVLALVFVVGLLLATAWVARRSGWIRQRLGGANLKVLGTLSLGARGSVALVQVEDTRLVLGVTAQQITLLHTFPAGAAPGDFSESLGKAVARS